jgi:hypothetical protein
MAGTTTIDGGDITVTVAKTDGQSQVPIYPGAFSSGTWTPTIADHANPVVFITRTAANQSDYLCLPIITQSRTTALKGVALTGVKVVATFGGTLNTTDDDFTIILFKVSTPANAGVPVGSLIVGSYAAIDDTKAKRLTAATHTFVYTVDTPTYLAAGEQLYVEIMVKDNANADLTFILKGVTAQFNLIPL